MSRFELTPQTAASPSTRTGEPVAVRPRNHSASTLSNTPIKLPVRRELLTRISVRGWRGGPGVALHVWVAEQHEDHGVARR